MSALDERIAAACQLHGALTVSDAAYAAMSGSRATLVKVGLGDLAGLPALYRATTIAYKLMEPGEQAADLTKAAIDAAKIERR